MAVTDGATAGAVWFDNVRCAKAGLLGQDLVSNLPDAWNLIYQGAQGLLSPPTGKTVFDMFEALSNPTSLAQTVTNNFALLQDILNTDPGQVLGTVGLNGAPPPGLGAALADGNLSFDEVFSVLTYAAQGATSALNNALEGTKQTLTGLFDGFLGLFGISTTAKNNSLVNADNIQGTAKAIYNGYFGTGGSGQIAEVESTISAIKTQIFKGYTLETLTVGTGSQMQDVKLYNATGGTFTLSYKGQTTAAISYGASAATVKSRLEALSTVGTGGVTSVTYATSDTVYYNILFNTQSSYQLLTVNSSLTGSSVSTVVLPYWKRPWTTGNAPAEMYAIVFGSGGGGGAGQQRTSDNPNEVNSSYGGSGAQPGGYAAVEIDATTVGDFVYYYPAAGGSGQTSTTTASAGA